MGGRFLGLTLLLGSLCWGGAAQAHGIWGHVHVTAWAIENLPEGELRDFFSDPEVFNAALFGAAFTDSGYFPQAEPLSIASRAYTEHTHWEPFIEDFIAWIRQNDAPPWDDRDSRLRAAFLMGCAAHGLQDEIFDSLFLYQVAEHDDGGQDEADPATDGFLALDGHLRHFPRAYVPMDTLLELYAPLQEGVEEATIRQSVNILTTVYLNERVGPQVALGLAEQYRERVPWTRAHYLDPEVPGSLLSEVAPTGRYLEAIWARLHGRLGGDAAVIYAWPAPPRRLLGLDTASPDSWVTAIFGVGARYEGARGWWRTAGDAPLRLTQRNTRWNNDWTRLVRLLPEEALEPGGWYVAGIDAGVPLIDARETTAPWSLRFQAPCAPESPAELCPDLGELPTPDIDGPEVLDEPDLMDIGADDLAPPDLAPDLAQGDDLVAAPDQPSPGADQGAAAPPAPAEGGCGCQTPAARPARWWPVWLRRSRGRG
jgi:hypothetical protein